jgi:hypothetical protein
MFGRPIEKVSSDPAVIQELEKLKMEKKNVIPTRYNENSELTKDLPNESQVKLDFEL